MCSHQTKQKTQAHGQWRQITSHVLTQDETWTRNYERTHKSRVHTKRNNMRAHRLRATQHKTKTTWKHAAGGNNRVLHKTWQYKRQNMRQERTASERTLDRALTTKTGLGARVSESRHETETKLDTSAGIRTPRSQHETRHADKRAHGSRTLETVRSHKNTTRTGVSELCHKTKK